MICPEPKELAWRHEPKTLTYRYSKVTPTRLFRRSSAQFSALKECQIIYWVSDQLLLTLASGHKLRDVAAVPKGLSTGWNERFLRFHWELPETRRWLPYVKGGGYRKWHGLQWHVIDWERNGSRLRNFVDSEGKQRSVIRNERFYGSEGFTYTEVANSSFGVRLLEDSEIFDARSPAIIPTGDCGIGLLGILNSRVATFFFRCLSPGVMLDQAYAPEVPIPALSTVDAELELLCHRAIALKKVLSSGEMQERAFDPDRVLLGPQRSCVEATLLTVEAEIEQKAAQAYSFGSSDVEIIIGETGVPCGWYPAIAGYDGSPDGIVVPKTVCEVDAVALQEIIANAAAMYADGFDGERTIGDDDEDGEEKDREEEGPLEAGSMPMPAENLIESMALRLRTHPVSVYWLIEEMRRTSGLTCPSELRRQSEDSMSVFVLRLLGHRWRSEQVTGNTVIVSGPEGIVPTSEGHPRAALASRILEHVGTTSGRNCELGTGAQVSRWLEREFYVRHIRQFRGRPIAWQIQTAVSGRGAAPVFACLVYCHRVTGALPNIRNQYAGALRSGFESEQRALEQLTQLTADQTARKQKLNFWIDELKQFQVTLEGIEAGGFATPELRRYAIADAIHSLARCWLGRLREGLRSGPLPGWQEKAVHEDLHADLPAWIAAAVEHVDRQCVTVAPDSPVPDVPDEELTTAVLAALFRGRAPSMIRTALEAICREWRSQFDKALLRPLREKIRAAEEEYKGLEDTIENKVHRKDLKSRVKALKSEIASLSARAGALATVIRDWRCPQAENWVEWLAEQPLYDEFTSLDGRRPVPNTVAELVNQESQYAPDINDGVRVNIAPLQKAGILARDVLAAKDVDKAIADRAEWRADERRWCRQGVLPQPGWWPEPKTCLKKGADPV